MLIQDQFIESLHRPANTRLKSCKHVCNFIKLKSPSKNEFRIHFFFYILSELFYAYSNQTTDDYYGLPSQEAIEHLHLFFESMKKNERLEYMRHFDLAKQNKNDEEKKIFSLAKTIGYYIHLTHTFELIDDNFQLTSLGNTFENMVSKKDFTKLSSKEKLFLFERVIAKDILFILPLLFWRKIITQYPDLSTGYGEKRKFVGAKQFISEALSSKKFIYVPRSWDNYIVVRNQWLKDLDCIGRNGNLKPSYLKVVLESKNGKVYLDKIKTMTKEFIRHHARPKERYYEDLIKINKVYNALVKKMNKKNYAFINLYDIIDEIGYSYSKLQTFLNHLADDKENWQKVHFNNIIGAADSRKRFIIKRRAILNIKISKDLG